MSRIVRTTEQKAALSIYQRLTTIMDEAVMFRDRTIVHDESVVWNAVLLNTSAARLAIYARLHPKERV